jgi:hypothetical protein
MIGAGDCDVRCFLFDLLALVSCAVHAPLDSAAATSLVAETLFGEFVKFTISVCVAGPVRRLLAEPALDAAEEVAFLFDGLTPVLGAVRVPLDAEEAITPGRTNAPVIAPSSAVGGAAPAET